MSRTSAKKKQMNNNDQLQTVPRIQMRHQGPLSRSRQENQDVVYENQPIDQNARQKLSMSMHTNNINITNSKHERKLTFGSLSSMEIMNPISKTFCLEDDNDLTRLTDNDEMLMARTS